MIAENMHLLLLKKLPCLTHVNWLPTIKDLVTFSGNRGSNRLEFKPEKKVTVKHYSDHNIMSCVIILKLEQDDVQNNIASKMQSEWQTVQTMHDLTA